MQQPRALEKIVKGFANHRRIEILALLERQPELSLFAIAKTLEINLKTAAEHVRRLSIPGLVTKKNAGRAVHHTVSPLGKFILTFLRKLE